MARSPGGNIASRELLAERKRWLGAKGLTRPARSRIYFGRQPTGVVLVLQLPVLLRLILQDRHTAPWPPGSASHPFFKLFSQFVHPFSCKQYRLHSECRNHLNRNDTVCDILLLPLYHPLCPASCSFLASCVSTAPPAPHLAATISKRCLHHGRKCAAYGPATYPPRCSANWRAPVHCIAACTRC